MHLKLVSLGGQGGSLRGPERVEHAGPAQSRSHMRHVLDFAATNFSSIPSEAPTAASARHMRDLGPVVLTSWLVDAEELGILES
jgi:hypothetical protein